MNHGVITVGGIYDETGPIDATVERDTVRSYFDLVNAQGGVNGYKFQLIDCDSKYDPSSAHQCAQKLISQGVLAIVGWLSLSGEQNETTYLTEQGVPIIGGLGVPSEFQSPLSFPTTPSLVTDGTALGTHAGQIGLKKPGVIFLNANFIQPVEQSFLGAMKRAGHLAGRRRDGRRDQGRLHRHRAQVPDGRRAVDRRLPRPVLLCPPLPGDGAPELAPASPRRRDWTRRRRTSSTTPAVDRTARSSAPTRRRRCSSTSTTRARRRSRSTSTPCTRTTPASSTRSTRTRTYQWLAAEVFVQAVKSIGNAPVTRQSLVNALNDIKNFDDGGLTPPFSYGPGSSHDPLHCLQWLHNYNGQWRTTSNWNCFG